MDEINRWPITEPIQCECGFNQNVWLSGMDEDWMDEHNHCRSCNKELLPQLAGYQAREEARKEAEREAAAARREAEKPLREAAKAKAEFEYWDEEDDDVLYRKAAKALYIDVTEDPLPKVGKREYFALILKGKKPLSYREAGLLFDCDHTTIMRQFNDFKQEVERFQSNDRRIRSFLREKKKETSSHSL